MSCYFHYTQGWYPCKKHIGRCTTPPGMGADTFPFGDHFGYTFKTYGPFIGNRLVYTALITLLKY